MAVTGNKKSDEMELLEENEIPLFREATEDKTHGKEVSSKSYLGWGSTKARKDNDARKKVGSEGYLLSGGKDLAGQDVEPFRGGGGRVEKETLVRAVTLQ